MNSETRQWKTRCTCTICTRRFSTSSADHEKLTYRYAGRDFRLTDVHGSVVHDILS